MTNPTTEEQEDLDAAAAIRSRANTSLAILEKAFIRNGSGRYFVLRANNADLKQPVDKIYTFLDSCGI